MGLPVILPPQLGLELDLIKLGSDSLSLTV